MANPNVIGLAETAYMKMINDQGGRFAVEH